MKTLILQHSSFAVILVLMGTPAMAMGKKLPKPAEDAPLLCSVTRMGEKIAQIQMDRSKFGAPNDTNTDHFYCANTYKISYPDWTDDCALIQNEQHVRICEYHDGFFQGRIINQRYSIGPKGFSDDMGDSMEAYMAWLPSTPVSKLEDGMAARMTNSDVLPAYGPNVDVVCILGDQSTLDTETAQFQSDLKQKRSTDYDSLYRDRQHHCDHH